MGRKEMSVPHFCLMIMVISSLFFSSLFGEHCLYRIARLQTTPTLHTPKGPKKAKQQENGRYLVFERRHYHVRCWAHHMKVVY